MSIFLGLDSSTQSLSAVAIDFDRREILDQFSVNFDERLSKYGCVEGALPNDDKTVFHCDPLLWVAALDLLFKEMRASGFDLGRVRAIGGSGQQHGSVYVNESFEQVLANLDPKLPLVDQIVPTLSRKTAPIWKDASTTSQCREIETSLGGGAVVAELTGSSCFERFTGPQIRKFFQQDSAGYAATARVHLVSSFMASLLAGRHAAIDHGDGAGMNLMDIRRREWSQAALDATAPGLLSKLPALARSDTVIGSISEYFSTRYGFSPHAQVVAWTGDNPASLVGLGLITPEKVGISLGTSDTYFGFLPEPLISKAGEGHLFCSPTNHYMSLICFSNGSDARKPIRDQFNMSWQVFNQALDASPPGNRGRVLLPYFIPEITPHVPAPRVTRYGLDPDDPSGNVRGVVEAQMASMAIHSRWMNVHPRIILATGGAAESRGIRQVMADVHNADVYEIKINKSAALGAALRAAHASLKQSGKDLPWEQVVAGLTDPVLDSRVTPNPAAVGIYREFTKLYEACENHALHGGPDPGPLRARLG